MIFKNKLEYYKSLDEMPIANWFKIQQTNDLKYMLVKTRKVSTKEVSELEKGLKTLSNEYIDTFGISDEYRKILELSRDIEVLKIDFILTQDRSLLTMIEIKKDQLKAISKNKNKSDVHKLKMYADKYMGFSINTKEVSVKEFYTIIESLKEESQQKNSHE